MRLPTALRYPRPLAGLVLSLGLASMGAAGAANLTVSPILVEFAPGSAAQGLWIGNSGDGALHAQLRVFAWDQAAGEDRLQPTRDLVLSPPMLTLPPGQQQLVRVIRAGAPAAGEHSYRILVDELPDPIKPQHRGLSFVMRFSVPVFALAPGQSKGGVPAAPLDWRLLADSGGTIALSAANAGAQRAQIADLAVLDAQGHRLLTRPGLFGYVLAGATRRWPLRLTPVQTAAATAIQARINGETVRQNLRLEDRAR